MMDPQVHSFGDFWLLSSEYIFVLYYAHQYDSDMVIIYM